LHAPDQHLVDFGETGGLPDGLEDFLLILGIELKVLEFSLSMLQVFSIRDLKSETRALLNEYWFFGLMMISN